MKRAKRPDVFVVLVVVFVFGAFVSNVTVHGSSQDIVMLTQPVR